METSALVFDKYEIVDRLARGGMGEVCLARQQIAGFDRLVILKSLLGELADLDGFVEQFMNEARVTAALNHPNIVGIYEVGAWRGTYYIVLEYIDGVDLSTLQKAARRAALSIPFEIIARLIHDAAQGLAYAHRATHPDGRPLHMVHRDISPHNIMVRRDGVVKIVDFGIAKSTSQANQTRTGVLKGKISYMPPEQIKGADLDGRTDVYSLGVVFWELCAGKPLFRGTNEFNTLQRVLRQPVPSLVELRPDIPPEFVQIVSGMLERDVEKRTQSADEVAARLATFLERNDGHLRTSTVASFVEELVGADLASRSKEIQRKSVGDFVISLDDQQATLSIGASGQQTEALHKKPRSNVSPDKTTVASPARLELHTDPSDAEVFLDGTSLGHTPLVCDHLPVGRPLRLVIARAGHVMRTLKIELRPGVERMVELVLKKSDDAPPGD